MEKVCDILLLKNWFIEHTNKDPDTGHYTLWTTEPSLQGDCDGYSGIIHNAHEFANAIRQAIDEATADLRAQLAERDAQLVTVCAAGQEVVNRWDSPSWKWDDEHTGWKVKRLRDAIAATRQSTQDKGEE